MHLGFDVAYRQLRPNPYLAIRLEEFDLDLHYFGIEGFQREASYGSCLILVEDTEPLFEALAAGLRAHLGKLPITGYPRITRPRQRRNAGGLSGFSMVDPGGNWLRVSRLSETNEPGPQPKDALSRAVANAIVLADSKGDVTQAARILAGALGRESDRASADDGSRRRRTSPNWLPGPGTSTQPAQESLGCGGSSES